MSVADIARATGMSYARARSCVLRPTTQRAFRATQVDRVTIYAFSSDHILDPAVSDIVNARTRVIGTLPLTIYVLQVGVVALMARQYLLVYSAGTGLKLLLAAFIVVGVPALGAL